LINVVHDRHHLVKASRSRREGSQDFQSNDLSIGLYGQQFRLTLAGLFGYIARVDILLVLREALEGRHLGLLSAQALLKPFHTPGAVLRLIDKQLHVKAPLLIELAAHLRHGRRLLRDKHGVVSPLSRCLLPAAHISGLALAHGNVRHAEAFTCDVDAAAPVVARGATLNDMLATVLGKRRHPSLDGCVSPAARSRVLARNDDAAGKVVALLDEVAGVRRHCRLVVEELEVW